MRTVEKPEGERHVYPEELQDGLAHEECERADKPLCEDILPSVARVLEGRAYALITRLPLLQVHLRFADPVCLACQQERGER